MKQFVWNPPLASLIRQIIIHLLPFPIQKYNPEDQPWLLQEDGPGGRKYKGVKEGGVTENTSYYIFQQAGSGAFEAFPIEVRKSRCLTFHGWNVVIVENMFHTRVCLNTHNESMDIVTLYLWSLCLLSPKLNFPSVQFSSPLQELVRVHSDHQVQLLEGRRCRRGVLQAKQGHVSIFNHGQKADERR